MKARKAFVAPVLKEEQSLQELTLIQVCSNCNGTAPP
jgi:hypothetical protein